MATTQRNEKGEVILKSETTWCKATPEQQEFYKKQINCDLQIECNDEKRVAAHRSVLITYSKKLENFLEKHPGAAYNIIGIEVFSSQIVRVFLNFLYYGETKVHVNDVAKMLSLASWLCIAEIANEAEKYLLTHVTVSNCFDIVNNVWYIRRDYKRLYDIAKDLAESEFKSAIKENAFLEMSIRPLCELIKSEKLGIETEDEAFNASIKWYKHDEKKRANGLKCLIENCTRPNHFLDTTKKKLSSIACLQQVYMNLERFRKPPRRLHCEYVLAIQKQSGANLSLYKYIDKEWREFFAMKIPQTSNVPHKILYVNESLIILNERNKTGNCNNVGVSLLICNVNAKPWTIKEQLLDINQTNFAFTTFRGDIYIIGGLANNIETELVSTVKCWNKNKGIWCVDSMPTARSHALACVLDDKLYVVGGTDGTRYLSTVECYNPRSSNGKWETCASMKVARVNFGLVVLGNQLYVIGGSTGDLNRNEITASVERYDPKTNAWTELASLQNERFSLCCTVVNNHILAIGGRDAVGLISVIEQYDVKDNKWITQKPLLKVGYNSCTLMPSYFIELS